MTNMTLLRTRFKAGDLVTLHSTRYWWPVKSGKDTLGENWVTEYRTPKKTCVPKDSIIFIVEMPSKWYHSCVVLFENQFLLADNIADFTLIRPL